MAWKLGPHDMEAGEAGKRWARSANIVKAVGNPAVLHEAPDHALRLWRWVFNPAEQDRMLDQMAVVEFANRTLGPLNGYNHPKLWIEGPNEVARGRFKQLVDFLAALKQELANRGYQLTGPCSSTGDYEAEDIAMLRPAKLGLWTFHGYMTKKYGPTIWNAYRMRNFWQSGDPPVVYSECGIDRCRDAPNGQYEPSDDGPYGWVYQYDGNLEQATTDITRYAYGLDRDWEWGATLFTTSPNNEWREKGFDCDPMVPRFVGEYAPWTPNPIPPEVPVVPDIVLSVPMRTSIASPDNYRVGPRAKTIGVVIHTTRGGASSVEREYTATINWFQNPDAQVSAHLVVGAGTFSEVCRSVHDDDVAWHARSANATHLGIEIAQPNLNSPISEFQYQAAAEACRLWAIKYNFPLVRVMNIAIPGLIGHEDTAEGKLDRKSDPGPVFDWDKFIRLCRREIVVPAPPTDAVALQEAVWALGDQLMKLGDQYTAANSPHRGEYCRSTGNAIKEWVNTASKGQQ